MDIRLVAIDLDGTALLDDHATFPPDTLTAMADALAAGVVVLPCTGRCRQLLPPALLTVPGLRYAVTSNGAAVWDLLENRLLFSDCFSPAAVTSLLPLIRTPHQLAEFFLGGNICVEQRSIQRLDQCYVPRHHLPLFDSGAITVVPDYAAYVTENGLNTEKINITQVEEPLRGQVADAITASGLGVITSSFSNNLEINTPTANKGLGLVALCRHLGLSMSQVMALGDNENDLEMMEMTGWGVSMANGTPSCKAAAKAVTASNEEGGVALAIRRWALSPR